MSFFSDIVKPLGLTLGGLYLGGQLFPETVGSLTGGLFGADSASSLASAGNVASAANAGSSIWSNPTVLSAAILSGTSLLGGLFGTDAEEDAAKLNAAQLEESKRQFDAELLLKKEQLAQALEIAKMQAGAGSSAASQAAATQLKIARANALANNATQKSQALQIKLGARKRQGEAAQTTGAASGTYFNNLIGQLQAPALVAAR